MKPKNHSIAIWAIGLAMTYSACTTPQKWSEESKEGYVRVTQKGGATLGYAPSSGVKLIEDDGYVFKDLNRNGKLDKYEDWRLGFEERAIDLASQLSEEEIAGLMLYSAHQQIPAQSSGYGASTYNGKTLEESGAKPSDLSDEQKAFLKDDNLRAVLITKVQSPEVAAQWNNNVQAYVEGMGHGIPANNSSDPRHETTANAEYNYGAGGEISQWPTSLGLAATFSPELVKRFGQIASKEYRALGITTALSPQVDLASEPRWTRFTGTFGGDPDLTTDLGRAYIDGFQTSDGEAEIADGWGYESVVAMTKHWPSGGPEEGGRDAHYNYGKYAVYPGNNLADHLQPFVEGAFKLDGPTKTTGAIMPYYTISYGIDPSGKNVGNNFSKYILTDLLREKYHFDGIVCTDWMVTADNKAIDSFDGKCWGVEELSVVQRHYEALKAGVDQFGGNNDMKLVLAAFALGVKEFGQQAWDKRIRASARRLLLPMFRTGLFENPYLDPAETKKLVGNQDFMKEGYDAQVKSLVMLKNKHHVLPLKNQQLKVYVPKRYFPPVADFFGNKTKDYWDYPVSLELVSHYYQVVDSPSEADFALVFIQGPMSGTGYDAADVKKGGNGYVPISLQYNDYVASAARAESVAGGDAKEDFTNRSYRGKSVKTANKSDLLLVEATKQKMGAKPVIVVLAATRPVIVEFEKSTDAILVSFGTSNQPVLDIVSGKAEPSGLLPCQFPKDMKTVEEQKEDVPRDMIPYVDSEGHTYDFAYGMNWKGVIQDERVQKYK
ncbi:glycoside hydrolase family 3 N-terminal domain-containing protein [Phocaeicola barnesiae]|uniref:glycoside hydrolase family 3 protein n=1 Tax=Phocaeicola barnesiae TaxID=376804 RepID=UPI00036E3B0C